MADGPVEARCAPILRAVQACADAGMDPASVSVTLFGHDTTVMPHPRPDEATARQLLAVLAPGVEVRFRRYELGTASWEAAGFVVHGIPDGDPS